MIVVLLMDAVIVVGWLWGAPLICGGRVFEGYGWGVLGAPHIFWVRQ